MPIPDHVKEQAYEAGTPIRENIDQVKQTGEAPPPDKQGRLSPQIEDRLNLRVRDSYEEFRQTHGFEQGMEAPEPESAIDKGGKE